MLNQIKTNKQTKKKKPHTYTHKRKLHPGAELWFTWKFQEMNHCRAGTLRGFFLKCPQWTFQSHRIWVNLSAAGSKVPTCSWGSVFAGTSWFFGSTRFPNTKASPSMIYVKRRRRRQQQPAARVLNSAQEAGSEEWRRHDQKEGGRWSEGGWESSLTLVLPFPCSKLDFE